MSEASSSPTALLELDMAKLASVPLDHAVEQVLASAQARLARERNNMQRRVDEYTMQQELALEAVELSIERAKQTALQRLEDATNEEDQPSQSAAEPTSPLAGSVLGTLMAGMVLDEPRNKSPSLVRPACRFVGFGAGASGSSAPDSAGAAASISAAPTKLSLHTPACRSTLALEIGSFPEKSGTLQGGRSDWPAPAPASTAAGAQDASAAPARPRLADEGSADSDDAPSPSRFATRRLTIANEDEPPTELPPSSLPIQIRRPA